MESKTLNPGEIKSAIRAAGVSQAAVARAALLNEALRGFGRLNGTAEALPDE